MSLSRLTALVLLAAVAAGPLEAGTISVAPPHSSVTLAPSLQDIEPATLTVSIATADPNPPAGQPDHLRDMQVFLATSGTAPFDVIGFGLAPGLPVGSFIEASLANGSVHLVFGPNNLSSFTGELYEFDFRGLGPGTDAVGGATSPVISAVTYDHGGSGFGADALTPTSFAIVDVRPFPEPASLTLAAVALCGMALAVLKSRRAAA